MLNVNNYMDDEDSEDEMQEPGGTGMSIGT